jgi:hypothetical protein
LKGDFSRQTFARKNHYSSVLMQQGRVQLDADWNEQADIGTHRAQTTTRDLIGACGGPLKGAAFKVTVLPRGSGGLPGEIVRRPTDGDETRIIDPSGVAPIRLPRRPNIGDDFSLGAGRYYVDGILCENEQDVRYSAQPDFPEATKFGNAPFDEETLYLLYLDVWQRHLTALDDPHIRETALGGPDTATRTKTVWQAKLWKVPRAGGVVCPDVFDAFMRAEAGHNKGLLNASSVPEDPGSNPCIVPPSAGYRGLENLLYRVEVHTGGSAVDVGTNAGIVVASFDNTARNQLTLDAGPAPHVGDLVELYPSKAGSNPMAGRLYFVTAVNNSLTLTLSRDIQGLEMSQQPRLRVGSATFKWSRQNGTVVTKVELISTQDNKQITVQSLGPDDDLGFSDGDWVELTDDLTELRGQPGQLTQIVTADNAARTVLLKDAPTVLTSRNAKMRRWDGIATVRTNPADADGNWIVLENGVRIQFPQKGADGSNPGLYATGDYWLIPTRTATADRESGQIEWPQDKTSGKPEPQPPEGIQHHYCPLALLDWSRSRGVTRASDCRRFFPPVTELTTLQYVSGTGQKAMPVLVPPEQKLVELVHPLVVGVSNGSAPVPAAHVVFEIVEGDDEAAVPKLTEPKDTAPAPNGRLSAMPGDSTIGGPDTRLEVVTDEHGRARCKWEVSTTAWNQQVRATLLGQDGRTVIHLPVYFGAHLSIAEQVAYRPGDCDKLTGIQTVQTALDKLCELIGLSNEPGIHVTDVKFGALAQRELDRTQQGNIENDFDLSCDALAEGLRVTCDRDIFRGSVRGKPTCFITLELPFPSGQSDKEAWGLKATDPSFFGYQPVVLAGEPEAEGQLISWKPSSFASRWLREILPTLFVRFDPRIAGSQRPGRILARLTLKGNYIWSSRDPKLYLDGDLFGVAEADGAITAAHAPSGDGKRGGDLEMWFWLVQFTTELEKQLLNIGESTTGRVGLSGPAPLQGATFTLSISDPTVATLVQQSVTIKKGETQIAFAVKAVKQGQAVIKASYAGGERQVTLSVQNPSTQPAPLLKVKRVSLISKATSEALIFEAKEGAFSTNIQLPTGSRLNVVEIEFTGATVNKDSVKYGDTFLVRRVTAGAGVQLQAGQLQWMSNSVVRWTAATVLARGSYSVALLSGTDPITNAVGSTKVAATDGRGLDGEPTKLPSGNNTANGTFFFTVQVT